MSGGVALGVALSAWIQRSEQGLAMTATGFGPLVDMGDLALPEGFSYRVVGREGEIMTDGLPTPGAFDGMGAFAGPNGTTILMRNHEIRPNTPGDQRVTVARSLAYDPARRGGCTKVVVGADLNPIRTFTVLGGTSVNCAGGRTPWGSWLTCEETFSKGRQMHGYVFEVPVDARGPLRGRPIRQLGRFKHEAVVWCKGRLYLTEDIEDSSFYRYTPTKRPRAPGDLRRSKGKLKALALKGRPRADTRTGWPVGRSFHAYWVTIDNVDPYSNNVRYQAQTKGAAIFGREEGAWASGGKIYFDCTDGGDARLGQIWEYDPVSSLLTLVYESVIPRC